MLFFKQKAVYYWSCSSLSLLIWHFILETLAWEYIECILFLSSEVGYHVYLLLHNKLLHHLEAYTTVILFIHTPGVSSLDRVRWVVLHGFAHEWGHLAAWLGLGGPPWHHSLVSRRFWLPAGICSSRRLAQVSSHGDWIPEADRDYAPILKGRGASAWLMFHN